MQAAEDWQKGIANLPQFDRIYAIMPFPLQVSDIVNIIWKYDGGMASSRKSEAKLMRYYTGMELFLNDIPESMRKYYLHGIIMNAMGLISYTANMLTRNECSDKHRFAVAKLMPILGLLLYKGGYVKEVYMNNTAYLFGQLLKLSDELHELYCKIVREGEVPPQLAGNSIFNAAMETPSRALELLGKRMVPYISWAKSYKVKGKEKSGSAARCIRRFEDVGGKLHSVFEDNTKFSDYEKAQLFLGYLAALPKSEKEDEE
jgi:hypothetical protein